MSIKHPAVKALARGLLLWAPVWIGAAVVMGLIGGLYAFLLKGDTYLASQALLVRDEANATVMRLGRFESQTQMKAAQETIMEMAKNRQVVHDTLELVGAERSSRSWFGSEEVFPSDRAVETFALNNISVHAPKGVEFGNTEVLYLDIKADTQARALKLVTTLTTSLDKRLRSVRGSRAKSVIAELQTAKEAAMQQLAETTQRIQLMESQVGVALGDLRGMTDSLSGGANSRTQLDQLDSELRIATTEYQQMLADLELMNEALQDPSAYVLAPNSVLNSQPGLKKLREGLADAQLATSQLNGRFTDSHPLVAAARTAQTAIEVRLSSQLQSAKISLEQDVQTTQHRINRLKDQRAASEKRLDSLAGIRSEYANLVSEIKTRSAILEQNERELAEAQASLQASETVSLLTKLDKPQVSDCPIGPGRLTITAICGIGGLLLGLGFVFAVTPIDGNSGFGRRWGDTMDADQRGKRGRSESQEVLSPPPRIPTAEESLMSESVERRLESIIEASTATKPQEAKELKPLRYSDVETSQPLESKVKAGKASSSASVRTSTSFRLEDLMAAESEYETAFDSKSLAHNKPDAPNSDVKGPANTNDVIHELMRIKESFDQSNPPIDDDADVSTASKTSERRQHPRPASPPAIKPMRAQVRGNS